MRKIQEVFDELLQHPMVVQVKDKQQNYCILSGFILRKPKFIKLDNTGVESCSLLLYQVNQTKGNTSVQVFSVVTYVKDIIKELKEVNQCAFVTFCGKALHSKKITGLYFQATVMEKDFELGIDLADEWEKKVW